MPEVTIKYKNPKTLKVLEELSKTMDFEIETFNQTSIERQRAIDEITVPADKEADLTQLFHVFTGKNLDAKKLREEAWRRLK